MGALIDAEFDRSIALGRVPAVFFQAVLIVGVVGLLALLSSAGGGTVGGGTGGTPGSRDAPTGTKRGNFASDLVDPVECAAMLGVTSVSVDAMGFDLPGQSMARMAVMNGSRRSGTRFLISVYEGRTGRVCWARAGTSQPLSEPGEAARHAGDRLTFKRGDLVVTMQARGRGLGPDVARSLVAVGGLIDRRLAQL